MTAAKHGIIPTERETVERGITKDSTNKQRRALGGRKEERFRTAIDDIEEAVKLATKEQCENGYEGRDSKFCEESY